MDFKNFFRKKNESNNSNEASKMKFKMPSSLTIIIITLFVIIAFTWIVSWSGGTYVVSVDDLNGHDGTPIPEFDSNGMFIGWQQTTKITKNVTEMGILSFGQAMSNGFTDAASLIFYLFILGAIIEIMLRSGALEAGVSSMVRAFKGKEIFLIPILVTIFSAGGTIYGMQEETLGLFIIIVPTLALAGFDTVTGLLVVLLGTTTGFAASTVNPFSIGAAVSAAGEAAVSAAGEDIVKIGSGLIFRLVWWLGLTVVAVGGVTGYAAYIKKHPERSFNKTMKVEADKWLDGFKSEDEYKKATKRQVAAVWIFMITFIIMVIMFIPWPDLLKFEYGDNLYGFGFLIGGLAGPGLWYFEELSMLFLVSGIIIALVLNMGMEKTSKAAWAGAKDMLSVGIIIGVARSIPYILTNSGTQYWLVQSMAGGLGSMSPIGFIYMMFFIFLILALLVPSTSGLASLSMGIFMPLAKEVAAPNGIDPIGLASAVMMVFVLATGIVNMFVPTQAVVMASCAQARVSYGDAMKPALSFAGLITVITLAAIIPSTLMLF